MPRASVFPLLLPIHLVASSAAGNLHCWGEEVNGVLDTPSSLGKVVKVTTGYYHNCALQETGAVACWGADWEGQSSVPGDLPAEILDLEAGNDVTCALLQADRSLRCWGNPIHQGFPEVDTQLIAPPAGVAGVVQYSIGSSLGCAVTSSGAVTCWGEDNGATGLHGRTGFASVSCGGEHTCGLRLDGGVECVGDTAFHEQDIVPQGLGPAAQVVAGMYHTCVLLLDGSVECWGGSDVDWGALPLSELPPLESLGTRAFQHTCGVDATGELFCFGKDDYSQTQVPTLGGYVLDFSVASSYTCVVVQPTSSTSSSTSSGTSTTANPTSSTMTDVPSSAPPTGFATSTPLASQDSSSAAFLATGASSSGGESTSWSGTSASISGGESTSPPSWSDGSASSSVGASTSSPGWRGTSAGIGETTGDGGWTTSSPGWSGTSAGIGKTSGDSGLATSSLSWSDGSTGNAGVASTSLPSGSQGGTSDGEIPASTSNSGSITTFSSSSAGSRSEPGSGLSTSLSLSSPATPGSSSGSSWASSDGLTSSSSAEGSWSTEGGDGTSTTRRPPSSSSDFSAGPGASSSSLEKVTAAPPSTVSPQERQVPTPTGTDGEAATTSPAAENVTAPPTITSTVAAPQNATATAALGNARQCTQQQLAPLAGTGGGVLASQGTCSNTAVTPLGLAALISGRASSTLQPGASPGDSGRVEYLRVPVLQADTVVELPFSLLEEIRPQVPAGDDVVLSVSPLRAEQVEESRPPPGESGETLDVAAAVVIDLALLSGAFLNTTTLLRDPIRFTLPVPYSDELVGARWDEGAERWSREGASVGPSTRGSHETACVTRHFGLFAALWRGFARALLCSQFQLLTMERIDEVRRAPWDAGAAIWTASWACVTGLLVMVIVVDELRRKSHPWKDEFFIFIDGPGEATGTPKAGESLRGQGSSLRSVVRQSASSMIRGSTYVMCDVMDEIFSKYAAYFAEVRSTVEGLLEHLKPGRLHCFSLRSVMQIALGRLVQSMSSRMAGADMGFDHALVDYIIKDDNMSRVLIAIRGEEDEAGSSLMFHPQQLEMWSTLHNNLLERLDGHLTKTTWCDAKSMAALAWSRTPIGAVLSFNVFASSRMKLFYMVLELKGAFLCSVAFFVTSGSVRGRPLGPQPMCEPDEAASYLGRLIAVSTVSLLIAWLPVALLRSLQTRRLVHLKYGEEGKMAGLVRIWRMQDRAVVVLGTLYLALATFLVTVFLANLDRDDNASMATSIAITAAQEQFVAPTLYGVFVPVVTGCILCALTTIWKARPGHVVHRVRDAFYGKALVKPPSIEI